MALPTVSTTMLAFAALFVLAIQIGHASAFSAHSSLGVRHRVNSGRCSAHVRLQETTESTPVIEARAHGNDPSITNRGEFFRRVASISSALVMGAVIAAPTQRARAKEVDPALKGTKDDPKYQACLSECIYTCTKPKGGEQKTRAECIPECKKQCATTKQQLMIGTPINKAE